MPFMLLLLLLPLAYTLETEKVRKRTRYSPRTLEGGLLALVVRRRARGHHAHACAALQMVRLFLRAKVRKVGVRGVHGVRRSSAGMSDGCKDKNHYCTWRARAYTHTHRPSG
uniref:Putative secreted peptide n=1 Tax=Anopheles braziliensis TaxID=58242 RepID=A0A2M3ZV21_9DIPT